jgi:hypothetical protein
MYGDRTNKTPETRAVLSLLVQKNKYEEIISIIEANKDKYIFSSRIFYSFRKSHPRTMYYGPDIFGLEMELSWTPLN